MKKYLPIVAIVVILGGLAYVFFGPGAGAPKGRAVFSVTDDATGSLHGATAIAMTVDKVEVHSAAEGWATVSTASKVYDLLVLKQSGAAMLLADVKLDAGTYEQVRLRISKVMVTTAEGTKEAKLPSETLKIVGRFTVRADETSSVLLDFLADKSLHITGKGEFILAPVVKLETRTDAEVAVAANGTVTVAGGEVETRKTVGMDEEGETDDDFQLKGNLSIEANGVIRTDDDDANEVEDRDEAEVEGEVHAELSLNFSAQNNSGLSGTASLEEEDGKVRVKLVTRIVGGLLGAILPPQPAHIHLGACPSVGAVKYPLNPVVDGKSETVINASMADLKASLPLAINIHKSAAEVSLYIACTDIKF